MFTLETIKTGVFLLTGILLVIAASTDIGHRRISNRLVLGICAAFAVLAGLRLVSGTAVTEAFLYPVTAGALVLIVCTGLFARGLMGGGDVKLLSATALMAGPWLSLQLVLYTAFLGGIAALATLFYARIQKAHGPQKVPYGVAISAAGLWVCFRQFTIITV